MEIIANIGKNKGFLIEMTTITENTLKAVRMKKRRNSGIFVSQASMSLENRLRMRPIGVDSKNCKLQCNTDKII